MKNKIIKIIKNNFNLTDKETEEVVKIMMKDHDVSGPTSDVSEDAVIETTDNILVEMKKKSKIIASVLKKLAMKPSSVIESEIENNKKQIKKLVEKLNPSTPQSVLDQIDDLEKEQKKLFKDLPKSHPWVAEHEKSINKKEYIQNRTMHPEIDYSLFLKNFKKH